MKAADSRRLAEVRRDIPERARQLGSLDAVCSEFVRLHPDLLPVLGESLLRGWARETLRRLKEPRYELGGQLPLFGQFGDEILPRDQWTPGHYLAYYGRYANAAARNAAILRVLANEFAERFGRPIEQAA
jgi:hypothetical protein